MLRSLTLRTFVVNSGIMALGLAHSVLLARWLGPAGRGEVAATMLWPVLLINFGSMGLISSTLYFTALPESKTEIIFANGIFLAVVQTVIFLPIGYIALPWLLSSQSLAVVNAGKLYLLIIPFSLATQYATGMLQGRMHIMVFNLLRLVIPVGFLIGIIVLKMLGALVLFNIVSLHLTLNVLIFFVTLLALLRVGIRLGVLPDVSVAGKMLRYGAQVQVGDISQSMNLRLDQTLMAAWLPPLQLGLYVVAVSFASLSQVLSSAVRIVVTPRIARKDVSERLITLETVFRRYWLLSLLATLILALVLPFAIPGVFGNDFREAIWPAEILILASLFIGAKDVLIGGAQALGSPWLGSRADLVALVVTVLLLVILLPKMGMMGAAIATIAAYATGLIMVVYGLHHSHGISPLSLFRLRSSDLRELLASSSVKAISSQAA